jgi:hypothetical protein
MVENEPEGEIDIEQIMQQIRSQILGQRSAWAREKRIASSLTGRRFSPDFYDHLYQASLAADVDKVRVELTPSRLPLFGPITQALRRSFHDLVIFYVSRLAEQQAEFNRHLLAALSALSRELEDTGPAAEAAGER